MNQPQSSETQDERYQALSEDERLEAILRELQAEEAELGVSAEELEAGIREVLTPGVNRQAREDEAWLRWWHRTR